jgi:hypothetical protein
MNCWFATNELDRWERREPVSRIEVRIGQKRRWGNKVMASITSTMGHHRGKLVDVLSTLPKHLARSGGTRGLPPGYPRVEAMLAIALLS